MQCEKKMHGYKAARGSSEKGDGGVFGGECSVDQSRAKFERGGKSKSAHCEK